MSFTIRLSQDLTTVEAGATVPLSIEITNKAEETDRFEMQVEGLDPEWTASPEPVFNVGPGETHTQKVFFKPPRASESLAGNYPYVVKVRSLNSGDSRTAQGVLQIKAFNHLSMEISPKKGYTSPMRKQNGFALTIINLGNTEHTLQLTGADPEEECTYDFGNDQVTIGPGQQRLIEVSVQTGHTGIVSSGHLFGFVLSARSLQNPNVVASAQGQLEQRPLLSTGNLALIVLLLAVGLLWFAFRPQPPAIAVSIDDSNVLRGQSAHFHWKAGNANSVRLEITKRVGDKSTTERDEDLPTEGTKEILATSEDTITVRAFAIREDKTKAANPVVINVQVPVGPTIPKILTFKASKTNPRFGESVLFTFTYSPDVVKLVLQPNTDRQILPPATQIQITPTQTGVVEYQLFAYTKDGGVANSKVIKVDTEQISDAVINEFSVHPGTIQAPETKTVVTWNVTNAAKVELDDGTGNGLRSVDLVNPGMDVITDKPVMLKLIATDAKGLTTSKIVKIKYKALPPPVPTDGTGGGTAPPPTTTGGATTTTGGAR